MTTVYNNVVFTEGDCPSGCETGKSCGSDIFFVWDSQRRSLYDVKKWLSDEAIREGCNLVYDFRYGQRSCGLFLNNIFFYGKGKLGILPQKMYNELIKMHKK